MITVENATVDHPAGSGSNRTLRIDTDENLEALAGLAKVIKGEGPLACMQCSQSGASGTEEVVEDHAGPVSVSIEPLHYRWTALD